MRRLSSYTCAVMMAAASVLASCDNKPDIWEPNTASLCGEWVCGMYQEGEQVAEDVSVYTYNTAANDNNIWLMEKGYFEELLGSNLVKCEGKPGNRTFEGGVISDGQIFPKAVEVWPKNLDAGPITVDSIAFTVDFGGEIVNYGGHRLTGWE
ncbi:MAG: hypothetical protein MJZ66_04610 [Bacteroidales bacterium]|nr:hypothetical protein [Bacteroidales bacterium]